MNVSEVSGRSALDIIEAFGLYIIKAFLVTLDIQRTFDKLDHSFL